MDKEQAIRILRNSGSQKEDLRKALAFALDVEYIHKAEKPKSIFEECRSVFLEAYRKEVGVVYQYNYGKDGASLKQIIVKIEGMNHSDDADLIKATFQSLISNLPGWYRTHAFSLATINSKFNEIVAEIRKHDKKDNHGISDSYKAKILNDLHA